MLKNLIIQPCFQPYFGIIKYSSVLFSASLTHKFMSHIKFSIMNSLFSFFISNLLNSMQIAICQMIGNALLIFNTLHCHLQSWYNG